MLRKWFVSMVITGIVGFLLFGITHPKLEFTPKDTTQIRSNLETANRLTEQLENITDTYLAVIEENERIILENEELLKTVRSAAQSGVDHPGVYRKVDTPLTSRASKGAYLGQFKITYYNAISAQTDSNPSTMANGKIVAPGFSAAVDPVYWKLGTKFYVEGWGVVEAEDTGSAVKGRNRMDILVNDKKWANLMGRHNRNVWLYQE
jgi:3D (Asp-Asp-Asp) domain-containing protein